MNVKLSTMAAGVATIVIVATLGIIGMIGEQQMALADRNAPRPLGGLFLPIKCPPGEILVAIVAGHPVCVPIFPD